ncbi:MAG: D-erythronate dehydrogenase [Bacteroidota bacterium]
MDILLTGGAGFIGKKLLTKLLQKGSLHLQGQAQSIDRITVFDVVKPSGLPDDPRLHIQTGDISHAETVKGLIGPNTAVVFHLAAIVSADAEANFDLGMAVNLDGTRHLLEACRQLDTQPRMVFTSSVAVYGGSLPSLCDDKTLITPGISYGVQKYIGDLLVNDYSRKGYVDGRAIRLPTIVVRPGKPNKAASTFASSIIREPLAGNRTVCPVDPSTRMYLLSPRKVVANIIRAAEMLPEVWGGDRMLTLPGISLSIQEMVDALTSVAGEEVANRIDWIPDPVIRKIVAVWMTDYDAQRAISMGFEADNNFEEIVRAHIEDELDGVIA